MGHPECRTEPIIISLHFFPIAFLGVYESLSAQCDTRSPIEIEYPRVKVIQELFVVAQIQISSERIRSQSANRANTAAPLPRVCDTRDHRHRLIGFRPSSPRPPFFRTSLAWEERSTLGTIDDFLRPPSTAAPSDGTAPPVGGRGPEHRRRNFRAGGDAATVPTFDDDDTAVVEVANARAPRASAERDSASRINVGGHSSTRRARQ